MTEFIDLFSGAGGFSIGFEKAGFTSIAGYDINDKALQTYEKNHKEAQSFNKDISESEPNIKDIDLVIGSPPCQGFSVASGGERDIEEARNQLVFDFVDWIAEIKPKVAVMENVASLRNIEEGFVDLLKEEYNKAGYIVESKVLNSANYGVPQKRERFFMIALRKDLDETPTFPKPTHTTGENIQTRLNGDQIDSFITVESAMKGLPDVNESGEIEVDRSVISNNYQEFVFDSKMTYNHTAKFANDNDEFIAERIPQGKVYRSNRFSDKYVPVWEIFEDEFSPDEKKALKFLGKNRNRKEYKATDKKHPDYIPLEKLPVTKDVLEGLYEDGWLRKKSDHGGYEFCYDLNTQSGVRPKYNRLSLDGLSGTLTTHDFNPRQKLHPTETRGLSLREGARIQSFPDSFRFYGSSNDVAKQIGNAVAPLLSHQLALHIKEKEWLE